MSPGKRTKPDEEVWEYLWQNIMKEEPFMSVKTRGDDCYVVFSFPKLFENIKYEGERNQESEKFVEAHKCTIAFGEAVHLLATWIGANIRCEHHKSTKDDLVKALNDGVQMGHMMSHPPKVVEVDVSDENVKQSLKNLLGAIKATQSKKVH